MKKHKLSYLFFLALLFPALSLGVERKPVPPGGPPPGVYPEVIQLQLICAMGSNGMAIIKSLKDNYGEVPSQYMDMPGGFHMLILENMEKDTSSVLVTRYASGTSQTCMFWTGNLLTPVIPGKPNKAIPDGMSGA